MLWWSSSPNDSEGVSRPPLIESIYKTAGLDTDCEERPILLDHQSNKENQNEHTGKQ